MKYQFNLNAAQLQMIVEALRTKSNEFNTFSELLIQSAQQQQLAATPVETETVQELEEVDVQEEQTESENN